MLTPRSKLSHRSHRCMPTTLHVGRREMQSNAIKQLSVCIADYCVPSVPRYLNPADIITAALFVYFQMVSRPLELSLQSSLQLSLTVLVRYRSRGQYLALGEVYHPLWAALSSNPTPKRLILMSELSAQAFHLLWAVVPVKET
jgi:hypothetical protein